MSDNIIRKSRTGEPGNPGQFGTHNRDADTVELTSADIKEYESLGYWARVALFQKESLTRELVNHVLDTESEDDFMVRVARHPSSSADQIEQASKHHATAVRTAALANPNTAASTLIRIENEAISEELDYREQRRVEGRTPHSEFLEQMADDQAQLARAARTALAART